MKRKSAETYKQTFEAIKGQMKYLTTTFSPSMLPSGRKAIVEEIGEDEFLSELGDEFLSAVGHENTALLLSKKLKKEIKFARINIKLDAGDVLLCAVPLFRPPETREFTNEELELCKFRFFRVMVGKEGL